MSGNTGPPLEPGPGDIDWVEDVDPAVHDPVPDGPNGSLAQMLRRQGFVISDAGFIVGRPTSAYRERLARAADPDD